MGKPSYFDELAAHKVTALTTRGARVPLRLLGMLARRQLRQQYRGTVLGILWLVLRPLVVVVAYTAIFAGLLKVRFNPNDSVFDFAFYLYCGMAPWTAVHEAVGEASDSIAGQSGLIKGQVFPAFVLPLQGVITHSVWEVVGLGLLVLAQFLIGATVGWTLILLPLVIFLRLLFTAGLALIVASLQVAFSDTRHTIGVAMYVWMLATPIFYPPWVVPAEYAPLMSLNPAAHMVGIYRDIVLGGRLPLVQSVAIFFGAATVLLLIGAVVYRRVRPHMADLL